MVEGNHDFNKVGLIAADNPVPKNLAFRTQANKPEVGKLGRKSALGTCDPLNEEDTRELL